MTSDDKEFDLERLSDEEKIALGYCLAKGWGIEPEEVFDNLSKVPFSLRIKEGDTFYTLIPHNHAWSCTKLIYGKNDFSEIAERYGDIYETEEEAKAAIEERELYERIMACARRSGSVYEPDKILFSVFIDPKTKRKGTVELTGPQLFGLPYFKTREEANKALQKATIGD